MPYFPHYVAKVQVRLWALPLCHIILVLLAASLLYRYYTILYRRVRYNTGMKKASPTGYTSTQNLNHDLKSQTLQEYALYAKIQVHNPESRSHLVTTAQIAPAENSRQASHPHERPGA